MSALTSDPGAAWRAFGDAVTAAGMFVSGSLPALEAAIRARIPDPARCAHALALATLLDHALYDVLQALSLWVGEENQRANGHSVVLPPPPPFTPPPRPTDDGLAALLFALMELATSLLGEVRVEVAGRGGQLTDLFVNLADAAQQIEQQWEQVYGLAPAPLAAPGPGRPSPPQLTRSPMTTQAIPEATTRANASATPAPATKIDHYEQFGYAMKGLCSVVVLGERGVLALVDAAVHDPGRRATAHELVKAIDAAMYEVAAALTTWAQEQIDALRGNPDAVPDLPPFTPPPYPQDATSLAATLIAIINLAEALAGEAATVLPPTPSSQQLIGALSVAIANIQNDWQSVFGLQKS